ncbi:hypothetical protein HZS_6649, partial [Henneguya salminicola]
MDEDNKYIDFQAFKNHLETNTLGEMKLKAGDQVSLVDEKSIYLKVKNNNGNIGFAALSCLNGMTVDDTKNFKLIYMVHTQRRAENVDELDIHTGDIVSIKGVANDGWCYGKLCGKFGWMPCNFLSPLVDNFQKIIKKRKSMINIKSVDIIPKNLIETCRDATRVIKSWEGYEWYYTNVPHMDCQKLLKNHGNVGDYLVRLRDDRESLCLMILTKEDVRSFVIQIFEEKFIIGSVSDYSLRKLLDQFTTKSI